MKPTIPISSLVILFAAACGDSPSPSPTSASSSSDAGQEQPKPWEPCDQSPDVIYCDQFNTPASKGQWETALCSSGGGYQVRDGRLDLSAGQYCVITSASTYTLPAHFTLDMAWQASGQGTMETHLIAGEKAVAISNFTRGLDLLASMGTCRRTYEAPQEAPASTPRESGHSDGGLVSVVVRSPGQFDVAQYHRFRLEIKEGTASLYMDDKLSHVGENCSFSGPATIQLNCSGSVTCGFDYLALRNNN